MTRIVVLQFGVTVMAALIATFIGGQSAGISALLGGLCYAVPNALFALRLYLGTKKPSGVSPIPFFIGEFLKLLMVAAALAAVIWLYHDLDWWSFLIGLIVVLKSYLFLLFRR